jgi:FRG domain
MRGTLSWQVANASNLYPSIYRIDERNRAKRKEQLFQRYDVMAKMEERLLDSVPLREVHADRLVRWALLQHYEICPTPLLDVTPSLQVALSFALESNDDDAFLYLFGVPHVSGPISISVDAGTQIIQLAQLCPPGALRAHFQEAALLCNYPVPDHMAVTTARGFLFDPYLPQNFSCRLGSKFHLRNCRSWSSKDFHRLGREVLRPDSRDDIYKKTATLRTSVR